MTIHPLSALTDMIPGTDIETYFAGFIGVQGRTETVENHEK